MAWQREAVFLMGLLTVLVLMGCSKGAPLSSPIQGATAVSVPQLLTSDGHEIRILGRQGFEPAELEIPKGSIVEFLNQDPAQKALVLVFQKENTRQFVNSDVIQPGAVWERPFNEEGVHDYWSVAYGVRGRIVVR